MCQPCIERPEGVGRAKVLQEEVRACDRKEVEDNSAARLGIKPGFGRERSYTRLEWSAGAISDRH